MARLAEGDAIPGARFVDPNILARIGKLDLLARTVVDGFINGLHRAPYFGASIDFAEHRGYVPGDDIRRVDWRLYARTDRYYIKQYEAEINNIRGVMQQSVEEQQNLIKVCNEKKLEVQQVLEFFGQATVARVVKASPKLHDPSDQAQTPAT
jgi:hypothetical protein